MSYKLIKTTKLNIFGLNPELELTQDEYCQYIIDCGRNLGIKLGVWTHLSDNTILCLTSYYMKSGTTYIGYYTKTLKDDIVSDRLFEESDYKTLIEIIKLSSRTYKINKIKNVKRRRFIQ